MWTIAFFSLGLLFLLICIIYHIYHHLKMNMHRPSVNPGHIIISGFVVKHDIHCKANNGRIVPLWKGMQSFSRFMLVKSLSLAVALTLLPMRNFVFSSSVAAYYT